MLDHAADTERLRGVERIIADVEWRITCKLEHIEDLRLAGEGVQEAKAVLRALELGLERWQDRRAEILAGTQSFRPKLSSAG